MTVDLTTPGETEFVVGNLECRGGPGTLYTVQVSARNYRTFGFVQMLMEERINTPTESPIRLVVNPKRVTGIIAPDFPGLPAALRTFLSGASMTAPKAEDSDLAGLAGQALYDALGPLRKACLLNLFKKAGHASSDRCFRFLSVPAVMRQDRCFCAADDRMPEFLRRSEAFGTAPNLLHDPLPGFQLEDSFKSKDAHANLQVTFQRHKTTGALSADVDIDESSGIQHGLDVLRHAVTGGRTNPYLIREFMLLSDPVEQVLDPGYRFNFS